MALELVASGDRDALVIRDHLVPLVRARGTIEIQRDAVRVISWQPGDWRFEHWTPFNDLGEQEALSPGYRQALRRQHTEADLPYGLDAWLSGTRVLSVLWADGDSFQVAAFVRGPWERDALAL